MNEYATQTGHRKYAEYLQEMKKMYPPEEGEKPQKWSMNGQKLSWDEPSKENENKQQKVSHIKKEVEERSGDTIHWRWHRDLW